MLRLAGRALVRDLEDADLLDRVAEELNPRRVLLGRREHVEEPAAHRELAALGDHLDARVADIDEPRDHVLRVGLIADGEPDGHEVTDPGDNRLQHGPDRGDDHLERPAKLIFRRCRVGEAAEHGDPLPDGVRTRREPLVGQGLPAGERGNRVRRHERAQRCGQVLGPRAVAVTASANRPGPPAVPGRESSGDQRAQCLRRDKVSLVGLRSAGLDL